MLPLVFVGIYGGAILASSAMGLLAGGPLVVLASYLLAAFVLVRVLSRFA